MIRFTKLIKPAFVPSLCLCFTACLLTEWTQTRRYAGRHSPCSITRLKYDRRVNIGAASLHWTRPTSQLLTLMSKVKEHTAPHNTPSSTQALSVPEPPTGLTVKTPSKPLPEPRDDDTPRSRRTAAGPSRQAQAAPSPTKTLSQSMRNLAISPFTIPKENQPSTSSAQLTPPDSPIMPGALPKTPTQPSIALFDEK